MWTFSVIMFLIFVVFIISYGNLSIQDEEVEINKFLKPYKYNIQTIGNRTLLISLDSNPSGVEGKGLISFVMFYKLFYIAVLCSVREAELNKIFKKSSRLKGS